MYKRLFSKSKINEAVVFLHLMNFCDQQTWQLITEETKNFAVTQKKIKTKVLCLSDKKGLLCQAPSMHCSLENRKTGRVEEEVTPNSWQLEGLDKQEDEWTDRTDSRSWVNQRGCENHKTEGVREKRRAAEALHVNSDFYLRRYWGIENSPLL